MDVAKVKSGLESSKVLNEVLQIQKAAIDMSQHKIKIPVHVTKNDVSFEALNYLSAYFSAPIQTNDDKTPYIIVKSNDCHIIIQANNE